MKYIIKKICYSIFTLFVISIIVFSLFEIMPQSPILSKMSIESASNPEVIEALSEKYELDKPAYYRYGKWLKSTLSFEPQNSIIYESSTVNELIKNTLPVTLKLTFYSLALSLLIAIPLTIYIALNRKSIISNIILNGSIIFISIPSFFLALIIIYIFSVKLRLFSITSALSITTDALTTLSNITGASLAKK